MRYKRKQNCASIRANLIILQLCLIVTSQNILSKCPRDNNKIQPDWDSFPQDRKLKSEHPISFIITVQISFICINN